MDLSIEGKLATIIVPKNKGLQPLYEAVVNAFQGIEDANRKDRGRIEIIVTRENRLEGLEGLEGVGRVSGFTVVDDGIGFTDTNVYSFFTAYSTNKRARGGKGIGRFTFLKVFEKAEIDSHFLDSDGLMVARLFGLPRTTHPPKEPPTKSNASKPRTSVDLLGMKSPWREECESALDRIALGLIAHCIPYFMNPKCPVVELKDADHTVDLNHFFRTNFQQQAQTRTFEVDGHEFTLRGFRLWHNRAESKHRLVFAANHRAVISETLTADLPSIGQRHLEGEDGKTFVYLGFVEGDYLNNHVDAERLHFTFTTNEDDDAATLPGMPSKVAIKEKAIEAVKQDLAPYLRQVAEQAEEKVRKFIGRNPELKPMLRYLPKYIQEIAPDATEARINDVLQRHKFVAEREIRKEGQELLKAIAKPEGRPADYQQRIERFIEVSNELGKSALARYVAHRRVILEFLAKSLEVDPETADYPLEDVLHEIIYPMKQESTEVEYEKQNLWIIDERLAFHAFLSSDQELRSTKKVLRSDSRSRPDLMIFNEAVSFGPEDDNLTSLVVVEFKRPARDDFGKETPIDQAHRMIREIRAGRAKRANGRKIAVTSDKIPAYAYIICDRSERLDQIATQAGMTPTVDQLGYQGYFQALSTYIEIIPYSKLLGDAQKRNKRLFDKLFMA